MIVCKNEKEIDKLINLISKNNDYDFIYPYHKNKKFWAQGYSEGIFISYTTDKAYFKLCLLFEDVEKYKNYN